MTYRICLVCLGNICRSPMAASVLRAKLATAGLDDRVVVESAGTGSWHVGSGADWRARAALGARGYDDTHTARQFTGRHFADYDLVLALDAANLRDLRRIAPDSEIGGRVRMLRSYDRALRESDPERSGHADPGDGTDLDVPDPYDGGADGFELVLDQVEHACDGLVEELRAQLRTP